MEIVLIDPSDDVMFTRWSHAIARTFLERPPTPERTAKRAARRIGRGAGNRVFGALDGDEIVATFESYDADAGAVAEPGSPTGSTVPTENISAVTVSATHRRQGLLTRWMTADLRDAKERGMPLASLIASEARIYGRFGFGPVVESVHWSIAAAQPVLRPAHDCPSGAGHSVRFVDDADLRAAGPALYDAARAHQPGAAPRGPDVWDDIVSPPEDDRRPRMTFAHHDGDGVLDGYARVAITEVWNQRAPGSTAEITDMAVARPDVAPCLWRACLGIDLVTTVQATDRPLGDTVPELLSDRRLARQLDRSDLYWWRILDAPAALTGRWWSGSGAVTVEVVDPLGLASGSWRLDVGADGRADVTASTTSPDLTLGVDSLASLLAGQGSLHRLAAAGSVDEHTAGAVATLDRLAWAPTTAYVTFTWF